MSKFTDFFWPRLDPETETDKREVRNHYDKDIKKIEQAHWDPIEPVLEQARILDLREEERSRTAETKAAIYIAALVALAPLSATLVMDFFNLFRDKELIVLVLPFILVIVYLIRAFLYALKVIQVGQVHRVDIHKFIELSNHKQVQVALCKDILTSVRNNWAIVNNKVDNVKMAHAYLVRMLISFVLLLTLAGLMVIYPTFHEIFKPLINCYLRE